jgi:hypothetical protein
VQITASIGCAGNTDVVSGQADDLVKAADVALYQAKNSGRNVVVSYQSPAGDAGPDDSLLPPSIPLRASIPSPSAPFVVNMSAPSIRAISALSTRPDAADENGDKSKS